MFKNDVNIDSSKRLFEEGGSIAANLQNYRIRPQQLEMVQAVDEAIAQDQNLIVEAGPGVGKSLAYLVPFICWSVRENKKTVISTYTKALQNQLYVKDLPFLSRNLGVEFRYALCMGSGNYVCMRKVGMSSGADLFSSKRQKEQFSKIKKWISNTETGLVTDMEIVPDKSVWSEFARETDFCMGRRCGHFDECFYMNARKEQAQAHILVTNHAMLFTDISSEAQVLPDFQALVLDEAHTLESVATTHFGSEISNSSLNYIFDQVEVVVSVKLEEMLASSEVCSKKGDAQQELEKLKSVSDDFFSSVGDVYGQEDGTFQFDSNQFGVKVLAEHLKNLARALFDLNKFLSKPEDAEVARVCAEKCDKAAESLNFVFDTCTETYVYWLQIDNRKKGVNYSFHAAPIDISGQMRMHLFDRISPVVLTSATLSSSSRRPDLSFVKKRLGIEDPLEVLLDSPFDYKENVLMYLPEVVSDPAKNQSSFAEEITDQIIKIYDIMGGRIFALFTSYSMLNTVSAEISRIREEIRMLKQGDMPRYVLLDVFKNNTDSILMGTSTFWQGVDVPGTPLECVIITKLPFSVPTDPVNAARIKAIRDEGSNPFNEYQLPQAIMMFKQGFGRLIRSHTDRGVVAVLDPRIRSRSYGKKFIEALPECPRTDDINVVKEFFTPLD